MNAKITRNALASIVCALEATAYKKLDAHNVVDLAPLTVLIERGLIPVKGRV